MSTTPSNPVQICQPKGETLPTRLRSPDSGWSGDALAVDCLIAEEAASRIEELEKALRPFAAGKMPSARRSEIAFDRHGLRRCISPLELARDKAFAVLQPKGAAV